MSFTCWIIRTQKFWALIIQMKKNLTRKSSKDPSIVECCTINITTRNINRIQSIGLAFTGILRNAFVTDTVLLNLRGLPQLYSAILMWWNQSRMLGTDGLPWLHQIPKDSAKWASVVRSSALYYVPSSRLNAFAIGNHREGGIAVADEMLRTLNCREIRAFLIHKITQSSAQWSFCHAAIK